MTNLQRKYNQYRKVAKKYSGVETPEAQEAVAKAYNDYYMARWVQPKEESYADKRRKSDCNCSRLCIYCRLY